ncbi:AMH_1a_G0001560.mRNA.1.CDS.1 [Saccharomyces cerevisiae]|nr:EM14S01-3B_G0013350.mRNA.1.CDS.1 [Saccharomyces cerevisiae]CAI4251422.1 AMH_1a_G0001560.mRNA.1.CDS.1 [Saccharomyces cerevisiae]CAI6479956.1 AMH_1a_G0001560.mRNA.1.CDS.1 [Saccharomyces cerevisiae]
MNSTTPSIQDQYILASKVRSKLAKCVSVTTKNKDYNLRVLVGHANLLDKITENVETHNAATNALAGDPFNKGPENLSIEHIELSNANARTNDVDKEENAEKTIESEDYCGFYSSDEDPDADTLSSTDSEDDDDYEDYDFEYDYSGGDYNRKIDMYFSFHTAPNYQYLTHTNSHSEQTDELAESTPRYNALPATASTTEEEQDTETLDAVSLHSSAPIFRVLSRRVNGQEDDSENESSSDVDDGSVPLTRFHSCPITA